MSGPLVQKNKTLKIPVCLTEGEPGWESAQMICGRVVWCKEAEAEDGKLTDFREWELNTVKKAFSLHSWSYPAPYSYQSYQSGFFFIQKFHLMQGGSLGVTLLPAAEFCSPELSCLVQIFSPASEFWVFSSSSLQEQEWYFPILYIML